MGGDKKGDHHGDGWGWGHHHDGDSDSEDEKDGEKDEDSDGEEASDAPPVDRRHLPPDTYFAGAIGFGAEGDMCLYRHLESLSPPCVSAVADLYSLRSQYWAADQAPKPPHCGAMPVLLFLLGLLGLGLFVKKMRCHKRNKAVNSFLTAIHANPQLKAAVEQHTHQVVPEPQGPSPCVGRGCRLLRALGLAVGVLLASLLIAVSSLEVTGHIIDHLDRHNEEPGPVSALAALMILTAVCAIHVSLFFLAVRFLRCLWARFVASSPSPSAPCDPSPSEFSFSAPPERFVVVRHKLKQLKNIAFNSFRRPQGPSGVSNTNGMYSPLLAHEDESEMVAVLHPVSASPLNQVNMV